MKFWLRVYDYATSKIPMISRKEACVLLRIIKWAAQRIFNFHRWTAWNFELAPRYSCKFKNESQRRLRWRELTPTICNPIARFAARAAYVNKNHSNERFHTRVFIASRCLIFRLSANIHTCVRNIIPLLSKVRNGSSVNTKTRFDSPFFYYWNNISYFNNLFLLFCISFQSKNLIIKKIVETIRKILIESLCASLV